MINRFGLALLIILSVSVHQRAIGQVAVDTVAQKQEVEGLVSFYKYLLNTLGSDKTSARDKQVIIAQSFKKAFRDMEVQIEDNLDSSRQVVTNKNVAAYLQDVDFFFKNVSFEFDDVKIESDTNALGVLFYKASFTSIMDGVDIEGKRVKRSEPRFIEINYDEEADDLKIVSVYTSKVNREKELRIWWEHLSLSWKELFQSLIPLRTDSATNRYLKELASLDSLSLNGNQFILDLQPVSELRELKYLDASNTSISSLEPVRSLIALENLDVSNTQVANIQYLKYSQNLKTLNVSNTGVNDLSMLSSVTSLQTVKASGTPLLSFHWIKNLKNLKVLDLSKTYFNDNQVLDGLIKLEELKLAGTDLRAWPQVNLPGLTNLDISNTSIIGIGALRAHTELEELNLNSTKVSEISPLDSLKKLRKLYCNDTSISDAQASAFMKKRSDVLVLTNADQLTEWWLALSDSWKEVFAGFVESPEEPAQEELVRLVNIDSLNVAGQSLLDGVPLGRLKRLEYLDVSNNLFTDLKFMAELSELRYFNGDNLPVDNIAAVKGLKSLAHLSIQSTLVHDMEPLVGIGSLRLINIDRNEIGEDEVVSILRANPEAVVVYQTDDLMSWWSGLDPEWQELFLTQKIDTVDRVSLHRLVESRSLTIRNTTISRLEPLLDFVFLKELQIINNPITDLCPLKVHQSMESLQISGCPVVDIYPLKNLSQLRNLDISNTPVESLKPLAYLSNLEQLNCSGTNIKKLKGLSELYELETLNLSNTRVWKLDRLVDLPSISNLVCFNTRLRQHKIDEFQELKPDCRITFY